MKKWPCHANGWLQRARLGAASCCRRRARPNLFVGRQEVAREEVVEAREEGREGIRIPANQQQQQTRAAHTVKRAKQ